MSFIANPVIQRLRITLRGAVQGVGFRPFVFRLATELSLNGWVLNSSAGLIIEVEGPADQLARFQERLEREHPPAAVVITHEAAWIATEGATRFEILASDLEEGKSVNVLPDLATCAQCREELFDPANRRFAYPFTNCTNCGPRYTIIVDIPYDRPNTTMRDFVLCPACREEYENPANRRFHAQPNACPICGPRLDDTIEAAAATLRQGKIVALKGIGGFQLLADARNAEAVARLRQRKHREEKPFAVMMPSLEMSHQYCEISPAEADLLESQAAPIVLLRPKQSVNCGAKGGGQECPPHIAPNVAHCSPYLGVMLPYSPLHHLLMQECRFPLIATSGNRSDEPICVANEEARTRLKDIADHFLMHNRPIVRACDDSVVRLTRGRAGILRRARGYAPLGIHVSRALPPVLAVGGHLKNTVAIAVGNDVFLSQHIGDLDTAEARGAFERAIDDLCRLYSFKPEAVVCDLHPDYASTHWAESSGLPIVRVQHHQAHVAASAAENNVDGEYLGVAWDGTGYGLDDAIWGGEFFHVTPDRAGKNYERIAHLRPFKLPGGDAAVHEGWRSAASLLFEVFGVDFRSPDGFDQSTGNPRLDSSRIRTMLGRGINVVPTTSVGRLFDAVASITGIAQQNRFEGQAAMLLENEIGALRTEEAYPLPGGDWSPLIQAVVADKNASATSSLISVRFHNALVNWIVEVATRVKLKQVVFSGGVFQNRYLTEHAAAALESKEFEVYTHQRVPPNDGGISLGQAVMIGG